MFKRRYPRALALGFCVGGLGEPEANRKCVSDLGGDWVGTTQSCTNAGKREMTTASAKGMYQIHTLAAHSLVIPIMGALEYSTKSIPFAVI